MKLALEWKVEMKKSLEVLGFLMLVAAFGLVDEFNKDVTFKYFDKIVQFEQASQLFRAFGFEDKVHGFIQKLIERNGRLDAVPFIYEFELVNEFPPVPLLRAHSEYAEDCYRKICDKGSNSPKALDNAIGTQLAALRGILRLVEKYNLHSQYSPDVIRNHILRLRKHKSEKNFKTSASSMLWRGQHIGNKRHNPCVVQPNQQDTAKRLQAMEPTPTSTAPINTGVSSKQQSCYNNEGFPLASRNAAPANGVAFASLNPYLTGGQGTQHVIPSSGLYGSSDSSALTMYTNSADRLRGGVSATTAEHYRPGSSNPVNPQSASTFKPNGLIPSTSFMPHVNLLDLTTYMNGTNGDTGDVGLAGPCYFN